MKYLILPAITTSVIPMGIVTRTVRALTGDILSQDFVEALRAKGLRELDVFKHVIKNAAPTALAVMGLQLGYMPSTTSRSRSARARCSACSANPAPARA